GKERVRIAAEQHLADEKLLALGPAIEVAVGRLFHRQPDVAADRAAARILGAAVHRFHQARSAPGHHREAEFGEAAADLAADFVVGMTRRAARRSEHGHTRAGALQCTEAANQVAERADDHAEFAAS